MDTGGGRIRVLWLTKGLGPGGAERLVLWFAQKADPQAVVGELSGRGQRRR